ncbi:MAG: site-specific DNA-methyltransferase [Acidobacteria bacterium]|nr:site-specific DNA-methyltransferase [Acidobacteriota bacterium]
MDKHPLARLDRDPRLREKLLALCRIGPGEIWCEGRDGHRVGCLDAASSEDVLRLCGEDRASVAVHDLPYNFIAFDQKNIDEFIAWCRKVVDNTAAVLAGDSGLYLWIGADQKNGFAPLPELMLMMRDTNFTSRSFITLRNQRGYGTQKNWMSVRQELLYYAKGKPKFVPQYTGIPKAVKGYYKALNGRLTENTERGRAETIRAGNVWIDVQQVFYRMEENVNGCYAQKPLKAIARIIEASSSAGDTVLDFFSHSGTTLLAAEMKGRRCLTMDIDPLYCEITIRRLEHYRRTGRTGWQNSNPFVLELGQTGEENE